MLSGQEVRCAAQGDRGGELTREVSGRRRGGSQEEALRLLYEVKLRHRLQLLLLLYVVQRRLLLQRMVLLLLLLLLQAVGVRVEGLLRLRKRLRVQQLEVRDRRRMLRLGRGAHARQVLRLRVQGG